MPHATFAAPDLTTFCRLNELGLVAVSQDLTRSRAVIECRVVDTDPWCRGCGEEGVVRDSVPRRLAHEPFGHRPTTLLVRVRRYRCEGCGHVWREHTAAVAPPRAKISRGGLLWALRALVVGRPPNGSCASVRESVPSGRPRPPQDRHPSSASATRHSSVARWASTC